MMDRQVDVLAREFDELRARVGVLEQALEAHGIALPGTGRESLPSFLTIPATPANAATVPAFPQVEPAPMFQAAGVAERGSPERSLESRIGSQWFNRIGILAVLIGLSWFLKLAIDNHWIGPLGRVVIGLLAGIGFIVWSERFHRKGYPAFSYSLKAVGSGALYLSLWAASSFFHLMPMGVAFAAMIAVTAFNAYLSWLQDAELLALYSLVGGFSTPLLVSTGQNHQIALFSYLLLLDVAILLLVMLRPWSRLLFVAFAGTIMFWLGWGIRFYSSSQAGRTAALLACFFLLFAFAPRLVRWPEDAEGKTASRWDGFTRVVLPVLNAALGFFAFYGLLADVDAKWAQPWLAVVLAGFYLLLMKLPARGVLRGNSEVGTALHLTSAVVFLAVAIPLKAHGRWLTTGWLVQGAALLWVAYRVRLRLLRVLALLCLGMGLTALVLVNPAASITPLLNERFATYLVAIAVMVFAAVLARRARVAEHAGGSSAWAEIASVAALLVNILILLAVGWEIHGYWWFVRWRGNWDLMHDYRMYAQFTYSAFFMLFGAVLLGAGFWKHSAFLRWQALVLLAAAIGKVFVGDVSALSQGYRILSFLALGLLLLAVSFVYQRDWLHLREQERDAA